MPSFRRGTTTELLSERPGLQRLAVDLGGSAPERAYALTALTGPVAVGDPVIVNTTAVELGLGTGGWHVVHWNLARADGWSAPGPGHVMKLRYTSLQADVGAAEELTPDELVDADGLDGTPVVVCGLHSQLAGVATAFHHAAPGFRLVYVMTDGASLPLALSDLVHDLRAAGLLAGTVTAGQAFGGDLEAVHVVSALVVARRLLRADAVVVAMGPGVAGTGTRFGFSAMEVGPILDAAAALGGQPIAVARASLADPRPRHQGVSHHTTTALDLGVRARVTVPLPAGEFEARLRDDLDAADLVSRHRVVGVAVPDVGDLLAAAGLHVTTMGRGPADDPVAFAAAGAAGVAAAALVPEPG